MMTLTAIQQCISVYEFSRYGYSCVEERCRSIPQTISFATGKCQVWFRFIESVYELLRYSKDEAEVDIVMKSAVIAHQIEQLRNNGDNDDFFAEQLNLMCQAPSRYRYSQIL